MLNLDKNKKYLLACSYGPDSMALFSMLLKEGYDFTVAHVNYNLRAESKDETLGLSSYCEQNKIFMFKREVEEDLGKSNIEAKCRKIRYEFFKEVYQICHADALLVAHNQDDLIETYFLQKKRKNLVNCYGIKQNSTLFDMNVIRPLLDFKKSDLTKYCKDNNVPFAIDSSNLLDCYQRNIIRHTIVEKMSDQDRVDVINQIDKENNELKLIFNKLESVNINSVSSLLELDEITFRYAMFKLGSESNQSFPISNSLCEELHKVLESFKPNVVFPINGKVCFAKEYDYCFFDKNNLHDDYSFIILEPCVLDTDYFFLDFTKNTKNRNVYLDDYPLTIRNYKAGDKYLIKDYEVLVRRLFIDWKMPLSLRYRWPIILNKDNKIIYIPRYTKDFKPTKDINFFVK